MYNRCIAQAADANTVHVHVQCARPSTGVRTIGASLRLPMPNTVQVQVKCAHPRSRTHVHRRHRSGYPCRPLCKYKYSVHAHVHAPTHNRCIAHAAHAEHCTRSRTGCTSTHAHSRTIGASLRRPMPNSIHIRVRCARSTPLACNGYTPTHNRNIPLTTHAEHCASIRIHTSARKVHHSVRTCRTRHTHIHTYSRRRVHGSCCTCRPPYTYF